MKTETWTLHGCGARSPETRLETGRARADAHLQARLDGVIDRWVTDGRLAGVTAMVARAGEVVYGRAAGSSDREAGIPASERTIYRLASMTKTIVSVTALRLVEIGVLSLDDSLTRWLPEFAPSLSDGRTPDITIRQLMTHTSGLSYSLFEPADSAYRTGRVPLGLEASSETLYEVMQKLAAVPLVFLPGTEWRYSISTDVLGAVIERASGRRLPEAVALFVTRPLGMTDTAFVAVEPARLAAPYREGSARAVRMRNDLDSFPFGESEVVVSPGRALDPSAWPSGGGGMSGTAEDYLRFLEALRTGGDPILSPASAELLATHLIGDLRAWTEGEGWGFGLGGAVLLDPEAAKTPQGKGTWQWGGILGSHFFVDPAACLSVVVLTNTAVVGTAGAFPAELRDALYGTEMAGLSGFEIKLSESGAHSLR